MKPTLYISLLLSYLFLCSCQEEADTPVTVDPFENGKKTVVERGPVKVVVKTDKKDPTLADKVLLKTEVIAEEGYEITMPSFNEKLNQFGIIDFQEHPSQLIEGGNILTAQTYTLEPFLSGEYIIPSMEFQFTKKGDPESKIHRINTDEIKLTISSLLPTDKQNLEIHDIAPPVELAGSPVRWQTIVLYSLSAIGSIVLLLLLFKWWKNREVKVRIIPAHETAFAALEALIQSGHAEKGEYKLFYQKISDILRHYIERRFTIQAPEQTTEEFLTDPKMGQTLTREQQQLLKNFLTQCDLVKFAAHKPANQDIQNTFDACKAFIIETQQPTI